MKINANIYFITIAIALFYPYLVYTMEKEVITEEFDDHYMEGEKETLDEFKKELQTYNNAEKKVRAEKFDAKKFNFCIRIPCLKEMEKMTCEISGLLNSQKKIAQMLCNLGFKEQNIPSTKSMESKLENVYKALALQHTTINKIIGSSIRTVHENGFDELDNITDIKSLDDTFSALRNDLGFITADCETGVNEIKRLSQECYAQLAQRDNEIKEQFEKSHESIAQQLDKPLEKDPDLLLKKTRKFYGDISTVSKKIDQHRSQITAFIPLADYARLDATKARALNIKWLMQQKDLSDKQHHYLALLSKNIETNMLATFIPHVDALNKKQSPLTQPSYSTEITPKNINQICKQYGRIIDEINNIDFIPNEQKQEFQQKYVSLKSTMKRLYELIPERNVADRSFALTTRRKRR